MRFTTLVVRSAATPRVSNHEARYISSFSPSREIDAERGAARDVKGRFERPRQRSAIGRQYPHHLPRIVRG
jgi:hypothetical protein